MKLLVLFILLLLYGSLLSSVLGKEKILILVDVSIANIPGSAPLMRRALVRAYSERLSRLANQGDLISIYQFSSKTEQVLTWTNIFDTTMVKGAISNLIFDSGCLNWEGALRDMSRSGASKVIFVTDENPTCAGQTRFAIRERARMLHGENIKVFPIGFGSSVSVSWLKNIAGPCNSFFGCKSGIDYIYRKHYHVKKKNAVNMFDTRDDDDDDVVGNV